MGEWNKEAFQTIHHCIQTSLATCDRSISVYNLHYAINLCYDRIYHLEDARASIYCCELATRGFNQYTQASYYSSTRWVVVVHRVS